MPVDPNARRQLSLDHLLTSRLFTMIAEEKHTLSPPHLDARLQATLAA